MSVMDVFSRRDGNRMVETTISFGKAGAAISQVTRDLKAVRAEAGAAGKGFLQNTAQVTSWAISVGALYGTLGLVRASITSLGRTDAQLARLSQVFNGVGGSARQLAIDVLQLASANGRSAEEGLASAIQWSRLGLTRAEVNEAVRVSLVAANVAELSASDATEKLSGIMAAYNLRVRDLAGVLGQLNAVSNEYNVTNAAMLDGISKTAGVARQAGLPLAELIGLIGGTVGSAAQSGASIGTAIKSITVALSNPRLQQALRNEFKVEVSRGATGEIKDLSTLFNELFIAYQRLNNAQRQNLLFQVAGKTQASRLASVLDNYVRSQVLAINAQLNLNSAEAENAKIKATLQARLTGLIAEFERFTAIQGQRGGGFALGQAVDSLRTGLAVMNLPGVNVAVSGLIVLLGAAVAKLALTAVTMREVGTKGGFVINSLQGVANAFNGLGVTANRVVRNFTATKASATLLGRAMGTEVSTGVAGASRSLEAFGLRSLRAARASGGLALGLRASALAARTLSVALVAVWEFALPLLVVAGAVWGINKAFNATTDAIAEADRRAQGFGDSARAAGEAAKSAAQAARLMDTLATVLPGADDDSRKRWLRDLGQVDQGLAHQLDLMLQQGRVTEATNLLLRKRAQFQQQEITNRATELANLGAEEESIRASIAKLSRRDNDESRQAVSRFEARLGEIQGERVGKVAQGLADNERDLQQSRGADQQVVLFAERTKLAAQSLSEFYKSTPQASPVDRLNADVAALSAEVELYDNLLVKLKEDSAEGFANQALLDRTAKLRNEIRANQLEVGKLTEMTSGVRYPLDTLVGGSPYDAVGARRARFFPEQDRLDRLTEETNRKITELRRVEAGLQSSGFDPVREQAQQQELLDARDKAARELAAKDDPAYRSRVQFQNEFDLIRERAAAARSVFNFGNSDAEKLSNQMDGVDRILGENRAKFDQGPLPSVEARNAEVRILDALITKQQLLVEMDRMRGTLAQQYNQQMREAAQNFQKTLTTGSTSQLLKTVSAVRLNRAAGPNGMTGGQFLALDPSVREQVQNLGQFNPALAQLQRDARLLGPKLSDADMIGQMRGAGNDAAGIYRRLAKFMPSAAAQGGMSSDALGMLNAAASTTTVSLQSLGAAVDGLAAKINGMTGSPGPAPTGPFTGPFGGSGGAVRR
jgi:TP901 family phage tail tape measure protein